jgi:hypothetical protein
MERTTDAIREDKPLVEPAPDEFVTRALSQSAYPVEYVESRAAREEAAESDES